MSLPLTFRAGPITVSMLSSPGGGVLTIMMGLRVAAAITAVGILVAGSSGCGGTGTATQAGTGGGSSTSTAAPEEPPVALHLNTGDYSTTNQTAVVAGRVTRGAEVEVDGSPAHVRGSRWSRTVHLNIGGNSIEAKATLAGHRDAEETITITRHHTQPELEAIAQARREREARERAKKEREEQKEREEKEVENASVSQQNALKEAESYLNSSAFSEAGLIEQLSSEAGSKFPHADAVWAVEHLHVDWNEQAVKEARNYLSSSSFSCQGLIEQLSSEAGSKFTQAQAEYGAKQVGLC
ncbi:MAG TPA: Ltp family lipoprotein [Solirubrobacteraceae bacterium]|nr:Ltp family lipoprotein [Solirubrobacteraceae bacterium]